MSERYDADLLKADPLGIRLVGDFLLATRLPIPLAVHFVTAADMERSEGPYECGRIRTRETPDGEDGIAIAVGDAIVFGTEGEAWPVERERFEATYTPAEGGAFGTDGLFTPAGVSVAVRQMSVPFSVSVAGGRLFGQAGDWLVQHASDVFGVVADRVFRETYALHGPA